MSNVRVHLKIEGRVQGVWFRESTRKKAQFLGVLGWVRNRSDGTVEAVAEGEEDKVKALVSWCYQGPPSAQVTQVTKAWDEWQGEFNSFDVVFSEVCIANKTLSCGVCYGYSVAHGHHLGLQFHR